MMSPSVFLPDISSEISHLPVHELGPSAPVVAVLFLPELKIKRNPLKRDILTRFASRRIFSGGVVAVDCDILPLLGALLQ